MEVNATHHCGVQASLCSGFSYCKPQALEHKGFSSRGAWSQYLYRMDLVAAQRVESFQVRDQTRVPCIDRWILNHWITSEVLHMIFCS